MPPRAKKAASAVRSRSRSASQPNSRRTSLSNPPAPAESPSGHCPPQPDPVAVQRLIDEAMKRAAARRASTPAGRASQATRAHAETNNGWIITRAFNALFPARDRLYSSKTTAILTDLIGAFLVTCLAIYFTAAGYLFYRDMALSS